MRREDIAHKRREVVPAARGIVLELGVGSAVNASFYGSEVAALIGIDTSRELLHLARPRTASLRIPVVLVAGSAEALPISSESVDTVVVTWSLCSIDNPSVALAEAR